MNKKVYAQRLMVSGTVLLIAYSMFFSLLLPVKAVGQATIANDCGFVDYFGYYQVVGEVMNTGDVPIRNVHVTITLYDAAHAVLDTDGTSVMPDVISVGRKGSFGYTAGMAGSEVNDYSVEIAFFDETSDKPEGLEIVSPASVISGIVIRQINVTGQIRNIGTETANGIRISATFFDGPDGTGEAVGVAHSSLIMTLDPSASTSFMIVEDVTNRESMFVSYVLNAESDEYSMAPVIVPEFPASVILVMLMTTMASLVAVLLTRERLSRL